MTTDDNDAIEVQTDTCHWCGRAILLMDSGVWTTRWTPVPGTRWSTVPGTSGMVGLNRCDDAPGAAKFHFPSSLAEKGDIVTDLPAGVVSLKEAINRVLAEVKGVWRASGYQAVMAALTPTEPLFPEGETRIRLPSPWATVVRGPDGQLLRIPGQDAASALHNLEQPGHQPPQESTCTRCGEPISEGMHGLWIAHPVKAWPARCSNIPGQRHRPRLEDLAPELEDHPDHAEELDHVPADGDWYSSTCQHCEQRIWMNDGSGRWATEDGVTDCSSVVVDAHIEDEPIPDQDRIPPFPDAGVTVGDAIGRVNAGPEGDWLRVKPGQEYQPHMTVTFPAGGSRLSGGPVPSDLPGLFHVDECDESDPAPGLRLMVGGARLGRMSYPEGVKLALDILVKARFRLAILEEQRGTHDGPHDLVHNHRPAAACMPSCPAHGTNSTAWRA